MKGPFILLDFADPREDDLLYLEHSGGEVTTRDDTVETSTYSERFLDVQEKALSPRETREIIDAAIKENEAAEQPAAAQGKRRRTGETGSTSSP
jgi:hypothetical protein